MNAYVIYALNACPWLRRNDYPVYLPRIRCLAKDIDDLTNKNYTFDLEYYRDSTLILLLKSFMKNWSSSLVLLPNYALKKIS